MKQVLKGFLSMALLCSTLAFADDVTGRSFLAVRPQVNNWYRVTAGVEGAAGLFPRCDLECFGGVVQAIAGYSRSFDGKGLGRYFSPSREGSNTFRVGPATDSTVDVINTNFFLGSNVTGDVVINPRVENAFIDLNFHLQLNEWICGLWFEAHGPINWTRTTLALEDTTTGSPVITGGTLAPATAGDLTSPFRNFTEAWNGLVGVTGSDVKEGMAFGRVHGKQSKWALADLEFALGYDFICNECSYLGASLRVIAPTGNRPHGEFIFEPISGSGKHTQVGAGLRGYYEFWNNCCDSSFGIRFDGYIYTMLSKKQRRTFDWTGRGVWSRYLPLKQFSSNNVFTGTLFPGANITTVEANVKVAANGEAVIALDYQRCGFTLEVGYDVWGRSKEKISITGEITENVQFLGTSGLATAGVDGTLVGTNVTIFSNGGTPVAFTRGLTIADLDPESAASPSAFTNKIFAYFGYIWENCDYLPFLGIGGDAEFSGSGNKAVDQWSIWAKFGFAFA